jgi:DNA-binding NarL/FixJ family response regulator
MPRKKTADPSVRPAAMMPADPASRKKRVFLVDDHPIVRQGLVQLINGEPDLTVVGEGEDAYAALKDILAAAPDVALIDISLKNADGLELLKELKSRGAAFPVLVLSMHDESLYAERALRAGAKGYVMKQEAPDILLQAIRRVLAGEICVSSRMGATLLQRMVGSKDVITVSPMEKLTDRELEVFRLIAAGQTVRQIAEKLCLSGKTVEAHREHIKEKLGLKTSAELLRFAIRNTPDVN